MLLNFNITRPLLPKKTGRVMELFVIFMKRRMEIYGLQPMEAASIILIVLKKLLRLIVMIRITRIHYLPMPLLRLTRILPDGYGSVHGVED
jgi:hypothetical protein